MNSKIYIRDKRLDDWYWNILFQEYVVFLAHITTKKHMYIYFELHKGRSGSLYRDLLMDEREKEKSIFYRDREGGDGGWSSRLINTVGGSLKREGIVKRGRVNLLSPFCFFWRTEGPISIAMCIYCFTTSSLPFLKR